MDFSTSDRGCGVAAGRGMEAAPGWTPHTRPAMRQDHPCLTATRLRLKWPSCGSWGSPGSLQDTEWPRTSIPC